MQPIESQSTMFGKYQLTERLGRGGFADAWKAMLAGPGGFSRTLVVKRIRPNLVENPRFVNMFLSEARILGRLEHINIVQVFELGEVDGEYFMAMEYVNGHTLAKTVRAYLRNDQRLPPVGLAAFVVGRVCRALTYLHDLTDEDGKPMELIHRDVSPDNIMLGFDGAVKLLDFGIAKMLAEVSEDKTETGVLRGKLGYVSPEQILGQAIDRRVDLFAAGIVLHETLTGRRLFKGETDVETMSLTREGRIPPPSELNLDVPRDLDQICLRALARDRRDRYASAQTMADDLDEQAKRLGWGAERLAEAMRRNFQEESANLDEVTSAASSFGQPQLPSQRRRLLFYSSIGFVITVALVWLLVTELCPVEQPKFAVPAPLSPAPIAIQPVSDATVDTSGASDIKRAPVRRHSPSKPTPAPKVQTPKTGNLQEGDVVYPFRK